MRRGRRGGMKSTVAHGFHRGDLLVGLPDEKLELGGAAVELGGDLAGHLRQFDEEVGHLLLDRALLGEGEARAGLHGVFFPFPAEQDEGDGGDGDEESDPLGVAGGGLGLEEGVDHG